MLRQDSSRMRRFAVQSGVIPVAVLMLDTASIIAVDTSSAFGVTSPTVISITPNNAVSGNNSVWVTIGGTGFVAGAGNVVVTNPDGGSGTLLNGFTVTP